MSLETPDKIRSLQRKLYCKAKAEPAFRFYVLYDKICRDDILLHAYRLARANAGAPGVDGMTFAQVEEQGLEAWLAGLREELVSKTYLRMFMKVATVFMNAATAEQSCKALRLRLSGTPPRGAVYPTGV